MNRGIRLFMAGAILGLCGASQAALLVHEGFDYATISPINGTQTGGVGFAAASHWGTANGDIVAGRAYAGLALSGNAFRGRGTAGNNRHQRQLASSFGGSTFYISALINSEGVNQERLGPELRATDGPCFGRVAGGWGMFGPANGVLGIANGGGYATWVAVPAAVDTRTHLIVVKIDYEANAIRFWLDPIPDSAEPAPSATLQTGGAWTINLNGQTWSHLALFHQATSGYVDEMRVGTTWQDVVPAVPMAAYLGEGFDYAAGPFNTTQTGGVGFAAGSYWPTNLTYNPTVVAGLRYSNLALQGSNAVRTAGYASPKRYVAENYPVGSFYIGLLINMQGGNPGRFGLDLQDANGPQFGKITGGWGLTTGNNGILGLSHSSGAYQAWQGVAAASDSATHLYVAKVDFEANAIKIFVDPVVNGAEPAPSATLTNGVPNWTLSLTNTTVITALRLLEGGGAPMADEFRVGRTWGSVVPPLTNTWSQSVGGTYRWVTAANWYGGTVANPLAGSMLDFSAVDLNADLTLALDGDRNATTWKFGDTAGAQNWIVNPGTPAGRVVLAGAAPTVHVAQNTATFNAAVAGSGGLAKSGSGTLVLAATNNSYSGATSVSAGTLRLAASGALPAGGALVLSGGSLELAAGTLHAAATLAVSTDSGIALGDGTARLNFNGDSTALSWSGTLTLTGTLGPTAPSALRFSPYGLTAAQLRRITIGGQPVRLDGNGYLLPGATGTLLLVY